MDIENLYTKESGSNQTCIDLFKNEWSTRFPDHFNINSGGTAGLLEDERIEWAEKSFSVQDVQIKDSRILELGPLEAGHTVMLEQKGAKSITAVEANSRAYIKCLIVKEMARLKKSSFVYADGMSFLETTPDSYDIGIVSGFLYHMIDPIKLIEHLSKKCINLYIWTVYYDKSYCARNQEHASKFLDPISRIHGEFTYTAHPYIYGAARDWRGFCGGPKEQCAWLTKSTIIEALRYFGYSQITDRDESNPNGPSVGLVATR